MKIRRLPEIDLAKCAALATQETLGRLEYELRAFNGGGGGWSYSPNRQSISDLLAAQTPLIGVIPSVPWESLCRQIKKACNKGEIQEISNLEVARILYDYSRCYGWSSVNFKIDDLSLGLGGGVRYWHNVVIDDGNGPLIPFFDHRRGHGISNPLVRQIVFSMQNVGVRERHPDLMDARLAVVRFPVAQGGRGITIDFHKDEDLLSYEELNSRVQLVYETWSRVSEGRTSDVRRTGTGGANPFGF